MDLYSEIILDHFKNPHNKGEIEHTNAKATEHNPLCGDKITAYLEVGPDDKVTKATFTGEGCAISQASVSMLTEKLIGKTLDQIKSLSNDEVYDMLNVPISPGRVKCALLGLVAFKKAAILNQIKA